MILTNVLSTTELKAAPKLYLSNGHLLSLDPLIIPAYGTIVVDLNHELAKQNISPVAKLTGFVVVDYEWKWDALSGTIRNIDDTHSLIFNFPLTAADPGAQPGTSKRPVEEHLSANPLRKVEGLWWKESPNVTAFLALANPTANKVEVTAESSAEKELLAVHNISVPAFHTVILELSELQNSSAEAGGLTIKIEGDGGHLIVQGGLQDEQLGYSTELPFIEDRYASRLKAEYLPQATNFSLIGEVGMLAGAADPMMKFPAGTTFTPYSIVRNSSDSTVASEASIHWTDSSGPKSVSLPPLSLAPHQTYRLDQLQPFRDALKAVRGEVTLALRVPSDQVGSLILASGSTDKSKSYVFSTWPGLVTVSASRLVSFWSTRNGDNTMITLWNPAEEAQNIDVTLRYTGGKYVIHTAVPPRAMRSLDVASFTQTQIPDDNGNSVPLSVHEGSVTISGPESNNQHILVAVDAATFNVQKGTCGHYTIQCDGIVSAVPNQQGLGLSAGDQIQQQMAGQWTDGTMVDENDYTRWFNASSSPLISVTYAGLVSWQADGSAYGNGHFTDLQGGTVHESDPPNNQPYCGVEKIFSGGFPSMPPLSTCTCTYSAGPDSVGSCGYNCQCAQGSQPPTADIQTFQLSYMIKQPSCSAYRSGGLCPGRIQSYHISIRGLSGNSFSRCL